MRNYLNNSFLKTKQNINMPIVKALLKYDQSQFSLLILEYVELESLTIRETFYITVRFFIVGGVLMEQAVTVNYSSLCRFNWEDQDFLTTFSVLTYLNADTDKVSIIKDNKGKSGVYL